MNLYKYHSDPKSLDHHDIAPDVVPDIFWKDLENNGVASQKYLKTKEAEIAKSAKHSYYYACYVLQNKPFPLGEPAIAKVPEYAFNYSQEILQDKPFPMGEKAIATSAGYSYEYALNNLNGPFPLGEPVIAKNSNYSYRYASHVLKKRFKLGEPQLLKDAKEDIILDKSNNIIILFRYISDIINGPWKEAEAIFAMSSRWAYNYANEILKNSFPLGEKVIAVDGHYAYLYAELLNKPFPLGEEAIAKTAVLGNFAFHYSKNILKARFLLAEPYFQRIYKTKYEKLWGIKIPRSSKK